MYTALVCFTFLAIVQCQLEQPTFQPNPFGSSVNNYSTYDVEVGKNGLTFEPNTLKANKGDTINFHFWPSNHSVAESTYENPCQPKKGGVDAHSIFSGFQPTTHGVAGKMFSMVLNSTDPIWLYCSQEIHDHCKAGQVMVINPMNNTAQTLQGYINASMASTNTTSPKKIRGGVLIKDNAASVNVTATGIDVATQTKKSDAITWEINGSTVLYTLVLLATFLITL